MGIIEIVLRCIVDFLNFNVKNKEYVFTSQSQFWFLVIDSKWGYIESALHVYNGVKCFSFKA